MTNTGCKMESKIPPNNFPDFIFGSGVGLDLSLIKPLTVTPVGLI